MKTKKEQELELACKQLVGVTAQMYPVVLSINLTKNTYNIIEYRDGTATNRENLKDVDALVENAIRTIHVDFREEFRRRSVSYTHLDVYKRQPMLHTALQQAF